MAVRGSASIDTGRFPNKDKEFAKRLNFPSILKQKVNMKKVVFNAVKPWIKQQIDTMLGFEDDVVINLIYNLLETEQHPDGQSITVKMMGFLENDTMKFMENLWNHLIDANNNKLGIPTKLLADAQKKQKIKKQQKLQNVERYQLKKEIESNTINTVKVREYKGNNNHNYNKRREHTQHREHREHREHRDYREQRDYTEHSEYRGHGDEERDSMNSIWPPSPSPPAILSTKASSPSPPKMLEKHVHKKHEKRNHKHKHKKRRRRKRHKSSSYSRSRSRSYSRSRSRSRSRDRGRWRPKID